MLRLALKRRKALAGFRTPAKRLLASPAGSDAVWGDKKSANPRYRKGTAHVLKGQSQRRARGPRSWIFPPFSARVSHRRSLPSFSSTLVLRRDSCPQQCIWNPEGPPGGNSVCGPYGSYSAAGLPDATAHERAPTERRMPRLIACTRTPFGRLPASRSMDATSMEKSVSEHLSRTRT